MKTNQSLNLQAAKQMRWPYTPPNAKWIRKGMMDAGEDRSMLPAHIKELKLPPGWKHLQFNPDPDAALLGIGRDAKGRD